MLVYFNTLTPNTYNKRVEKQLFVHEECCHDEMHFENTLNMDEVRLLENLNTQSFHIKKETKKPFSYF